MAEIADAVQETIENAPESRLNAVVAMAVAVLATATALCNVKDGNIVQAMAQAQSRAVDSWSYYQAKSTKRALVESALEQVRLESEIRTELAPAGKAALAKAIDYYQQQETHYEADQARIKKEAEDFQAEYDRLNTHDDQFDLAEACMSVGIAVAGVTALTQKRWLLLFVLIFGGLGLLMGFAGFLGWSIHSDLAARLLG